MATAVSLAIREEQALIALRAAAERMASTGVALELPEPSRHVEEYRVAQIEAFAAWATGLAEHFTPGEIEWSADIGEPISEEEAAELPRAEVEEIDAASSDEASPKKRGKK